MSLTYSTYVTTMAGLMSIQPESALTAQSALLEAMIAYAELRIYRELDFLYTIMESDTTDLTAGTRTKAVPSDIIIVNSMAAITPASTASAAGTRVPLQRVSMEFLNQVWPSTVTRGVPVYYAMQDNDTIVLAPTPDAAYRLCVQGVFRPDPLSVTTTTTFLTDNVPDLFIAASAVFGFGGLMQNFGAQSDNPQAAQSWEQQYQNLRAGVDMENLRSKAWATAWQPWSPSPAAKESRT